MFAYIVRRLLFVPPTLLVIIVVNFAVVQVLPGGPVEQMIAQLTGQAVEATGRITGNAGSEAGTQAQAPAPGVKQSGGPSKYRGAQGLPPEFIKQLEAQFGLDKPAHERFWLMLKNYLTFDFGNSYFKDQSVVGLVLDKEYKITYKFRVGKAFISGDLIDLTSYYGSSNLGPITGTLTVQVK